MKRIRVLVVDDSAFARKVLREILEAAPDMDVVGFARDGIDALGKIQDLDPDVVTLDLVMPNLDGLDTLRALAGQSRPKALVVCMAEADSDLALTALDLGAVDIVHKPTALATTRLYDLSSELVFKVRAAAMARARPAEADTPVVAAAGARGTRDVVVIGASTGGPHAVTTVLRQLPSNFPAAVAVVVHLPVGFTEGFAARLDGECALDVVEASEGVRLGPGRVVIARAGFHLTLKRDNGGLYGSLRTERATLHRPAVDELFESAAGVAASRALGVVLTGMGDDGLAGSRVLKAAGAEIVVESEVSAVVYGMPRVVWEAALASGRYAIADMARAILDRV